MGDYRRPAALYMTLGVSGSGKSTWAKNEMSRHPAGAIVRVNKDTLREMAHDGRFAGRQTEAQILAIRDAVVLEMLRRGVDVIVDDTNIAVVHETRLREIAAEAGARFELVDFSSVPVETCLARDKLRVGSAQVGPEVIRKQAQDLARRGPVKLPQQPEPYIAPANVPDCVLVDLDGTLALKSDRSPFDWHRVGEDAPNPPVVDLVRALHLTGEKIIVMSGRDSVCRQESEQWLADHVVPGLELFMRPEGDQRRDDIVKLELFNQHIRGRYNVKFVLDDRQRVVDMWRRVLGLTALQVAPGDFDAKPLTVTSTKQVQIPEPDGRQRKTDLSI